MPAAYSISRTDLPKHTFLFTSIHFFSSNKSLLKSGYIYCIQLLNWIISTKINEKNNTEVENKCSRLSSRCSIAQISFAETNFSVVANILVSVPALYIYLILLYVLEY